MAVNHNVATVTQEKHGLYVVREYAWMKEAPYDQPAWPGRSFVRTRGLYATYARAIDEADWVNHPELRKEKRK
jgi:hypothetical protein